MKYIHKQKEPDSFSRWKADHPGATYNGDLCSNNKIHRKGYAKEEGPLRGNRTN